MTAPTPRDVAQEAAAAADRWRELPAPVKPEDQVLSQPATEAPDVDGGRNPDQDWLLRGV